MFVRVNMLVRMRFKLCSDPSQPASVQMILQSDGSYVSTQASPAVVMEPAQAGPVFPTSTQYVDPNNPQVVYQTNYPVSYMTLPFLLIHI